MMLGLATKESFFPAIYKSSDDGSYFIVNNPTDTYSCYVEPRVPHPDHSSQFLESFCSHSTTKKLATFQLHYHMAFRRDCAAMGTLMDLSKWRLPR